jgi:hypothetical protein
MKGIRLAGAPLYLDMQACSLSHLKIVGSADRACA